MLPRWRCLLIVCLSSTLCIVYFLTYDSAPKSYKANFSPALTSGEEEVASRLAERRRSVETACKDKHYACNFTNSLTTRQFLFYDYNASVCPIGKAGSTTWRGHLRFVNHDPPRNHTITDDPKREPFFSDTNTAFETLRKRKKIITVRHPLTRLVSCFGQKYKGGRIVPPLNPKADLRRRQNNKLPNWRELFYHFWLPALHNNNLLPPDLHKRVGLTMPINPRIRYSVSTYEEIHKILQPRFSFVQFLNHVVTTYRENRPNRHWDTYTNICCPCALHFDFITRVETMSEDLEYVFKVLEIPSDPSSAKNRVRSSYEDPYKELSYYRDVPLELRKELYNYVKDDMDIFGYHLPEGFLGDTVE